MKFNNIDIVISIEICFTPVHREHSNWDLFDGKNLPLLQQNKIEPKWKLDFDEFFYYWSETALWLSLFL